MSEITKVKGIGSYGVSVTCPNKSCNHEFDAINEDCDSVITDAMFENTTDSCTDMQIDMTCPECELEFILDSITY